jgi:hypothetical protein
MGAGNASATLYKCDPNIPTGGGNKKQGITSRVGLDNWENREVQTRSNGIGRFKLFFVNQLGGVEPGHSMFGGKYNRGDGLTMNLYSHHLQQLIKHDEQNGIIVNPSRYYSGKPRTTSYSSCKLYYIDDDGEFLRFETKPEKCYISGGFELDIIETKINGTGINYASSTKYQKAMNNSFLYYLIITIKVEGLTLSEITSIIIKGNDYTFTLEY